MGGSLFVFQLVYASVAVRQLSPLDLERILHVARENNGRRGITGVLLYDRGAFIQALEGDEPAVRDVFARIGVDARHARVEVLWSGNVPARSFGDWSMGFVDGANADTRQLEGYRDFFGKQALASFWTNPSRATELLREFRDLPWRRALEESRPRR